MRRFLFYCILINIVFFSFADDTSTEGETDLEINEDKTTLFSYDINNPNDLYLSLDGSWKLDMSTFASGDLSTTLENLSFSQVPQIEASLWLFNTYFFETNITEESDDNTFLLGYQNSDTLVKEIRIGNDDLEIGTYAGFTPSINDDYVPGARIKLSGETSSHEILTKYTTEESDYVQYRGYNSLEDESITLNNYEREKVFVIPFDNFTTPLLYILDDNTLSEISDQNYLYNSDKNFLYIEDNDTTEDATLYLSMENFTLTTDEQSLYSDEIITKDGKSVVKLTNNGYSKLDHMGCYLTDSLTISEDDDLEIYLGDTKLTDYNIYDDFIVFNEQKPFFEIEEDIYSSGGQGINSEYSLTIEQYEEVSSITVPDNAKENSLTVLINDSYYSDYTHNSDSGVVTFDRIISSYDEIVITYKTDVDYGTGNLFLTYGSRFNITDNLTLELSNTFDWDFAGDEYSYSSYENPGTISSKGELTYESDRILVDLKGEVSAYNPDTSSGYMLFSYSESEILVPISSIEIDNTTNDGEALIKRDYDDYTISYDEIEELTISSTNGAYTVTHAESGSGSEVVVMETETLTAGQYSFTDLEFDDYAGDYSWAKSFDIDFMNSGSSRDITLTFMDDDGNSTFTDIVTVESGSEFTTYTIDFSTEDREELTNTNKIRIMIEEGDEELLLIKNMTFIGDSLVTHNGSEDFILSESDSTLTLETDNSFIAGEDIEISTPVSEINISNYGTMEFTVTNNGVISGSTEMTLKNGTSTVASMNIPSVLSEGSNEIKIDMESGDVSINGVVDDDITWTSNGGDINSFTVSFEDCDSGSMTISTIILTDPKWDFESQFSMDIEYTPEFSIEYNDFTIVGDLTVTSDNNLINSDETEFNTTLTSSITLLETAITSSIYYENQLERFSYSIELPEDDSPVKLYDKFSYDSDRLRESSCLIDMNLLELEITSNDTSGSDSGVRSSSFDIESSYNVLTLSAGTTLKQYRDDTYGDMDDEIISSYYDLIPQNSIENSNTLAFETELKIDPENLKTTLQYNGTLKQNNTSEREDINGYKFQGEMDIEVFSITFTPYIYTYYQYEDQSTNVENVTNGIESYLSIFSKSNPYSNLNFYDIFISQNRTDFFDYEGDNCNRSLSSELSLEMDSELPLTLKYSLGKDLDQEESLETSSLTHEISGSYSFSSDFTTELSFSRSNDIEENEISDEFDWDVLYYRETIKDHALNFSNSLSVSEDDTTNITEIEYEWPGKSGPLLIVPLTDKVFDAPYNYTHSENFYLKLTDTLSDFVLGVEHNTILKVEDMNETGLLIDIGWENGEDDKLNFELELYTTLIF